MFVDDIAEHVERRTLSGRHRQRAAARRSRFPDETALLTILVYLIALPFVLFAGAGS